MLPSPHSTQGRTCNTVCFPRGRILQRCMLTGGSLIMRHRRTCGHQKSLCLKQSKFILNLMNTHFLSTSLKTVHSLPKLIVNCPKSIFTQLRSYLCSTSFSCPMLNHEQTVLSLMDLVILLKQKQWPPCLPNCLYSIPESLKTAQVLTLLVLIPCYYSYHYLQTNLIASSDKAISLHTSFII